MCLKLINIKAEPKIAEEDIVVYKVLIEEEDLIRKKNLHGKEFKGVIKGIECSGKISIAYGNQIYLCTNGRGLDGSVANDLFGFKYSWSLDSNVSSIIVDNEEILIQQLQTPYRNFHVEIGKTYKSDLVKRYSSVEEGLHSFEDISECKLMAKDKLMAECIIPKGSTYYEGYFGIYKSYASNALKYIKLLKKEDVPDIIE